MGNMYVLESDNNPFSKRDCKVEIPVETVHLASELFLRYYRLTKVTIHENVKKMGDSVFRDCRKLKKVKIFGESKLVVIPENCFRDCESLESFSIPTEVGVIKRYAFKNCTNIKHIVIPDTVIAIEAGAFDGWTKDQTIEMYQTFKFGCVCKANIINHAKEENEVLENEVFETNDGEYMYAVKTKCGHVGRHRYMEITFPVTAESKKEAAKIARNIPRVKHDHQDAILDVKQICLREYLDLVNENQSNPYLKCKSKYQQKDIKDFIDQYALPETRKQDMY